MLYNDALFHGTQLLKLKRVGIHLRLLNPSSGSGKTCNYYFFFLLYPPSSGIAPCVGTTWKWYRRLHLTQPFRAGADLGRMSDSNI